MYLLDREERLLLGVDPASGEPRKAYRLGATELARPGGMAFAPSSDPTDDPGTLDLFVANRGGPRLLGGVTELPLAGTAALTAPVEAATLVRTVDTSTWKPASPDPSGIVYLPGPGRLEVADPEVGETTGAGYHGEPVAGGPRRGRARHGHDARLLEGAGRPRARPRDRHPLRVRRRGADLPGAGRPDGRFGTADDPPPRSVPARWAAPTPRIPSSIPRAATCSSWTGGDRGVGVGTEVYRIDPRNGTFGDDVVTHFDVGWLGTKDFEGLASDPSRGTLLVGA